MLKIARTADGYAARRDGGRLMISGPRSNARTHLIRARHDAIMVGIGTVLADDPLLTVRLPGLEPRSPVRVVVDSALRTPPGAQILRTAGEVPTWIVAAESASPEAERRLVAAGAEVMRVGARDGRVDIEEALRLLATRGITRIFSEGGPNLAEALIAADRVDEFATATSRKALGEEGFPALGPALTRALAERFVRVTSEDLGEDVLDIYERAP
jgi:diaminohydroxyphosphoribosylaminopyrimidine deaminase/5-amino-6-(5-phosphoribosylamino)uracil reductase